MVWTSRLRARFDDGVIPGGDMEIHRADKAYRNRSVMLLAGTVLLSALLLWELNRWLGEVTGELMRSDPDVVRRWLRALFVGLGIALALPAAALGVSLRRLGLASRIEGRFPPRQWKTWRDVRVLRDADALRWARRVEGAGFAALALALLLSAWAALAWWRYG
jgi:hypothetical protein